MAISSAFENKAVVLYNNAGGYSTGVALESFGQTAFSLPSRFPVTANRRGSILFSSSGTTLSGLGLRFNPSGSFTSFPFLTTVELQGIGTGGTRH